MAITMRIIQQFDAASEQEFMDLEGQFAELEVRRPDFPRGRRLQPISGGEPSNTLIWECDFPDLNTAHATLDFFQGDDEHEQLFELQKPFFRQVKVEFYRKLEFVG